MKFSLSIALSIALVCLALSAWAEPQSATTFETANPQMMMSAGFALMKFADEEKSQFGKIIQTFTSDAQQQIFRESRRNETDLPRRINRRLRYLFDDLDNRVKSLVNSDRQEGYQLFKAGLTKQMAPPTADSAAKVEAFKLATKNQQQHH